MIDILKTSPPPRKPGVYLFKNTDEDIIYIGKAKNLSKRAVSYFNASKKDAKTKRLIEDIAGAEYIITDNEVEALILENVLIKKHKPKYNIKLRDDKNYQYIVVDYSGEIALCYTTRKRKTAAKKEIKYFGPYTSGLQVRNTIKLIKTSFPYCRAKKITGNPCFNYHLHRCPGVCVGEITPEQYKDMFSNIELFLKGRTNEVRKRLRLEMGKASEEQKFEKAARLRNQLQTIEQVVERQKIIAGHRDNHDYISLHRASGLAAVNLFIVREGKLVSREVMLMESDEKENDVEIISAFAQRYYTETTNIPRVVFTQYPLAEKELLRQMLENRAGELNGHHKVNLKVPKRGISKDLISLGVDNARDYLENQILKSTRQKVIAKESLLELRNVLKMDKIPDRIESYDISNISGQYATGSMIVFNNGVPNKSQYRKFKIKKAGEPDDYGMMAEMVKRRLGHPEWPTADLWIIDGGKGQLNVVLQVLSGFPNFKPLVIGVAKNTLSRHIGQESVFKPGQEKPILLPNDSPALQLIQRIRDEAHRFAITYHRKLRSKALLED